jgi:chromatin segregation and condensation protein Rec8/ScpA/Scc1 (kleisin family)
MALLEMVKGREIAIEQNEPWGPISVSALADGG